MAWLEMDDPRAVVRQVAAVPGRRMAHDLAQNFGQGLIFFPQAAALASARVRLESSTHKASSIGMGKLSMHANSQRPASRKARLVLGPTALSSAPSRITIPSRFGRTACKPHAADRGPCPHGPGPTQRPSATQRTHLDILQSPPYHPPL